MESKLYTVGVKIGSFVDFEFYAVKMQDDNKTQLHFLRQVTSSQKQMLIVVHCISILLIITLVSHTIVLSSRQRLPIKKKSETATIYLIASPTTFIGKL